MNVCFLSTCRSGRDRAGTELAYALATRCVLGPRENGDRFRNQTLKPYSGRISFSLNAWCAFVTRTL